ncbi:hypothetical protein PYW07_010929 [Mythimna separata]|uniref:Uncharacterized protein n=1 Tax=Mythimna separata TaxID=271217 RepID=A0AAD7Y8D6_MYTSE|nr:hypothetical protein PYW07_010929 [Mythimna separata]
MMSKYLLLLFLPAIYARIGIKITTGETEADASVEYTGENVEIISDMERQTWRIGDEGLKKACEKFAGSRPGDVYVRSPTPWNDVYRRFNWDQVKRTLKPVSSRVLGIHTKPVIVASRTFKNNNHRTGAKVKYNAAIAHQIEETISNTWSVGGELTVGQEITYNVNLGAGSVGGTTSLSYAANWGNDTSKAKAVTLGTTTSVEVELNPGQAVVATLTATHGTLEMEVDYEAELSGSVFANYPSKLNGHYFWSFDVNAVLRAAGLPTHVKSTEKISVGFYTSATVEINDKIMVNKPNVKPMKVVPAGIISSRRHFM